ncbi:MAG: Holliday junction resolvase RuvX [Fibromonadaceae bacterium]|jgi:putative Holliday junction resolvase|nr:Holliday junction resolvase RuvX [Fibromonadaceae bacterium]
MPKNYLAIDYGERRVGIAFASDSIGIAFPRETIDLSKKDLWAELERLVKANKITDFVLGMPIHPNNHPDSKQKVVEKFAETLHKKFPKIMLHTQDESYSTQEAVGAIPCSRSHSRPHSERIDKAAATIILQRFLEGNF